MSDIDRDDDEPFRKRAREFARMLQDALRKARLGPDEPVHKLYDGLGRLPEEIDRIHEEWCRKAVVGLTRVLDESTRHLTQATAELIQAGRWQSKAMASVAAVALVAGVGIGYAVAPRTIQPTSVDATSQVDASINAAISRHCRTAAR